MPQDEIELVERAKRGDFGAFDALVRRYERQAFNFALKMTGNRDDAADVTQEAFLRVFNFIESFRGESSFSTWMYRVLMNTFLDLKKRHRIDKKTVYLEEHRSTDGELLAKDIEDTRATPEEVAVEHERQRAFLEAILSLPDYQRALVVMYHSEGMSYEQIAEVTRLPLGTVKSRMNRARLALREKLAQKKELFGP
jgi:RNA polymerase sigma-70 factor (ECF subfamily)